MVKKLSKNYTIAGKKEDVQRIVNETIEGDATIFINSSKVKARAEWVMLFPSNFLLFMNRFKNDLSIHDFRVLFCILDKMAYGNALSIKQNAVAKEIESYASNVSKSWRKLKLLGIFIEDRLGNEFMNYDLFMKGGGKLAYDKYSSEAEESHQTMRRNGIKSKQPFPLPKQSKNFHSYQEAPQNYEKIKREKNCAPPLHCSADVKSTSTPKIKKYVMNENGDYIF